MLRTKNQDLPLWKYIVVFIVVTISMLYALPNLYPNDPAVQIVSSNSDEVLNDNFTQEVTTLLQENSIDIKLVENDEKRMLIRFNSADDQLQAQGVLNKEFGSNYIVALNSALTTPDFLRSIGAKPINLGLDLSGGVHFLLEIDMDKAIAARLLAYESDIRSTLRDEKIRYRIKTVQEKIQLNINDVEKASQAQSILNRKFPELVFEKDDSMLEISISDFRRAEIADYSIKQNLNAVRNRVNELGVAEPLVQRQGSNRIVVELPGIQDTATAKKIIGKTANLEFRLQAADVGEDFIFKDGLRTAKLERDVIVTGDQVIDAQAGFGDRGGAQVSIRLDGKGGDAMFNTTRSNLGRQMGILFIEQKPEVVQVIEELDGQKIIKEITSFKDDKKIISLATIQGAFSNQFQITGLSATESTELALLLRSGALAAPMYFVEEQTIGPTLGIENIKKGIDSSIIALILITIFMFIIYRVFGLFASVALLINLLLLLSIMSMLGATLTLPGIAGIVLTLGMSVDANVLIFARIKEESQAGLNWWRAISSGFDRAFSAVIDANLTNLLVGLILFSLGSGPIRGFAVTLSVGVLTSLFTAIFLTKVLIYVFGRKSVNNGFWL